MPDSPLKNIILPFTLSKRPRDFGGDWNDTAEQLIHIEPMSDPAADPTLCAVVMEVVTKLPDDMYLLKLDIKFKEAGHGFKIDRTKSGITPALLGSGYQYDINLVIVERAFGEPSFYPLEEPIKLVKNNLMDLHFDPPFGKVTLAGNEKETADLLAAPRRICKVRVFE